MISGVIYLMSSSSDLKFLKPHITHNLITYLFKLKAVIQVSINVAVGTKSTKKVSYNKTFKLTVSNTVEINVCFNI